MHHTNKIIYLADDDDDDRMFMRIAIKESGWQATIVETENGQELLQLLREQKATEEIKLVVLDMNMPLMTGLEVLRAIRADQALQFIPAVIISTSAEPDLVREAYRYGINAYIKKPSSYAALNTISEAIKVCFLDA
ncbi:response regulator [Fibrella sp. HMF5335]|uniref:Response regulator n=1 Tax=Fibrella rubiginis TaxID=2817060 RepID=A0A939GCV7_9BACT|nr:response regulator [Fibrella rubiginis]MBO0936016.1 response regulator [Fibrella rubiginis]